MVLYFGQRTDWRRLFPFGLGFLLFYGVTGVLRVTALFHANLNVSLPTVSVLHA